MAVDAEFGRRARLALAAMDHPPQMKEIAERVRVAAGRATLTPQAVGAWFKGQEPESFELTRELAKVLGVDAGWLAFGASDSATAHSSVPNIVLPDPTQDRKLSIQETQRAMQAAELERREQSRSAAKKKRKGKNGRA